MWFCYRVYAMGCHLYVVYEHVLHRCCLPFYCINGIKRWTGGQNTKINMLDAIEIIALQSYAHYHAALWGLHVYVCTKASLACAVLKCAYMYATCLFMHAFPITPCINMRLSHVHTLALPVHQLPRVHAIMHHLTYVCMQKKLKKCECMHTQEDE